MSSGKAHVEALFCSAKRYPREFSVHTGIDFCSNDYLSLKSDPRLKIELPNLSWCSTGSRMVSGNYALIEALEAKFARYVNRPRALFFGSGYQANLAVIASLMANCVVFADEHNHASLIDGVTLSRADKAIFLHNDLQHLEELLKRPTQKPRAIISESIFSTDGSMADVVLLDQLAKKYDALLLIDESHATGVFGAGLLGKIGEAEHIISTHSCGKALASFGAFVASSDKIFTIIKNQCRQFICTTAPPPYLVQQVHSVLDLLKNDNTLISMLMNNIASASGILATQVPIIAVLIKDDARALFIKNQLKELGFDIAAFRYPSVKKNHAQLRITLHRANIAKDINRLRVALENLL